MRATQVAGLLTLSTASIVATVSPALAKVIIYDNSDGTFHWNPWNPMFAPLPNMDLDITLPPTQPGTATPLSMRMQTPSVLSSSSYTTYRFVGPDVARSGQLTFSPPAAAPGVLGPVPPHPFAPTEMIGPDAHWGTPAAFRVVGVTLVIELFGPEVTLAVRLVSGGQTRYGWIHLIQPPTQSVPLAVAWAYETEPDTPIAAPGKPDADGVLHVPAEYPTIRTAMNFVLSGQAILVADGTYTGIGFTGLDFNGKAFTLRSEGGAQSCILDAGPTSASMPTRGFTFQSGEEGDSRLEGFTIRNCRAWGSDAMGAAVRCDSNSSPTIRACIFQANRNQLNALAFAGAFYGGAISAFNGSRPHIENCLFISNISSMGGGIASSLDPDFAVAGVRSDGSPTIINCTFSKNAAPDAFTPGYLSVIRSSVGSMANCVVYGNFLPPRGSAFNPESTMSVSYSCIQGGYPGLGNISDDPEFADPSADDYHLAATSPCIDAASNPAVPRGVTDDLDGNPRFDDDPATTDTGLGRAPIVDMGAYEFQPPLDPADLDEDGDVDGFDLALLLGAWGPCPKSGECPADLFAADGAVNGLDLAYLLGHWT